MWFLLYLLVVTISVTSQSRVKRHDNPYGNFFPGLVLYPSDNPYGDIPPATNPDACSRVLDLCLLIDASKSTCAGDPNYVNGDTTCGNWSSILGFSRNLVGNLSVSETGVHVAAVLFATKGNRRWNLTRGTDKTRVQTSIDQLPYSAGYTNIPAGLDTMMNLVFNETFGDRPNVQNVALIFSDARSTDPSTVQDAIDRVHAANVETIVIGPKTQPDDAALKQLASDPKQINENYFVVENFQHLDQILGVVLEQLCQDPSSDVPVA